MDKNETEILTALATGPRTIHEIKQKFSRSQATLYRTIQKLETEEWITQAEGCHYALTEKGRRILELTAKK